MRLSNQCCFSYHDIFNILHIDLSIFAFIFPPTNNWLFIISGKIYLEAGRKIHKLSHENGCAEYL